jgi:RNA polymerase sigma-70 factor, ECF subfamily
MAAKCRAMTAPERAKQEDSAGAAGTLGDVLYPDKGKSLVLEQEWVALVQSIAGGDQRALHALYERTHRMVFTLAVRITGNPETAEEVTLDVFHDAWRRASTYDPANGTVIGWVMNQARSRAIDRVRLEQRKKRVSPDGDDSPLPPAAAGLPQETLELEERGRILREAVAALTPQERQAIETAYFSELTYAEAADRLNQPLGTIKTRIRSGLAKLREALAGTVKL